MTKVKDAVTKYNNGKCIDLLKEMNWGCWGEGKCYLGDCDKVVGYEGITFQEKTPWRSKNQKEQNMFKVLKRERPSVEQSVSEKMVALGYLEYWTEST